MVASGSTFRTDEPHLHELLSEVHKGQIQLPDFQRGWVWDDEHIRELAACVSLSYPARAVMLLERADHRSLRRLRLLRMLRMTVTIAGRFSR